MSADGPRLFLVAGEPSGDALGAALIRALREETAGAARFAGVGGPLMAAEGLESLFPQDDLAVMGLVEVLPRLPTILRRMRETVDAAAAWRPDALVTIDSPSFGLRVARRLKARAPATRAIHYVAPSVWAWRPGRARRMAAYVDRVLALLPFEPPFFEAVGLPCDFVGHPAMAAPQADAAAAAALRARLDIAPEAPVLLALPGSRMGELRRHMALFGETIRLLKADRPDLRVILPTVPGVADAAAGMSADWAVAPDLLDPRDAAPEIAAARKRAAFAAATAALCASGTVALELAAADLPMVSVYRANPLTAWIVRRLVSVGSANLVNLVAGAPPLPGARRETRAPEPGPVPELLQENFTARAAADAVAPLLIDGPARAAQRAAFAVARAALGGDGPPPETRAARALLADLRAAPRQEKHP